MDFLFLLLHFVTFAFAAVEIREDPDQRLQFYNISDLQNFESTERQMIEDEYSCKSIKGETPLETFNLRKECKTIMGTGIMQLSLSKLRQMDTVKLFRAKEKHFAQKGNYITKRSIFFAGEDHECPIVDENYIKRANNQINKLSISPYEVNARYDTDRLPRYISQDECLCEGCIDPATGRETLNYVSQKISITQDVFFQKSGRWFKKKETVTIGCTCTVPKKV